MNPKEAEHIPNKIKTKLYPHILQKYVGCQRLKNINKDRRDCNKKNIAIKKQNKISRNY